MLKEKFGENFNFCDLTEEERRELSEEERRELEDFERFEKLRKRGNEKYEKCEIPYEKSSKNRGSKSYKEKFDPDSFSREVEESDDLSKVRVIISPLEGRLSLGREEDVLYQLVLTPACEEVTIKGKTLDIHFVKGLEGIKYCALKKIIIKTLALESDFILVNGKIQVKTEGNSESVELEKAFFWKEDEAKHVADVITRENLKRLEYYLECMERARKLLKGQTKDKTY